MGLADKLGGITSKFKRKSLDQKIDEALKSQSSTNRMSDFSSTFSQLNKNAAERFRSEVSGAGKAMFTRAEERFDSNYPAIEKAPFGDMTQESPLTRDFDKFPSGDNFQSGFERMETKREPAAPMEENPFMHAATSMPSLPEENNAQPQPPFQQESARSFSTTEVSSHPGVETRARESFGETSLPLSSPHPTSTTQADISAVLRELQAIREQNAVILEKLKRIEERLR